MRKTTYFICCIILLLVSCNSPGKPCKQREMPADEYFLREHIRGAVIEAVYQHEARKEAIKEQEQ